MLPPALVLVALVPVACVLWFMTAAMRNERLAVQERLTAVHAAQLESVRQQVAAVWAKRATELQTVNAATPAATFAAIVSAGLAESVVLNDRAGKLAYPTTAIESAPGETSEWAAARALEFQRQDYAGAAAAYAKIADQSSSSHAKARALQSQAASLLKLGQKPETISVLERLIADPTLRDAVSTQGTLVVPNAQLLILKIIPGGTTPASSPTVHPIRDDLIRRLNDYTDPALSASQRRFLMEETLALAPATVFPTLEAEKLAADYLEREPMPAATTALERSALTGVWHLATADRSRLALWRVERLRTDLTATTATARLRGVQVRVLAPGEANGSNPIPPQDIGELLPGWRLAVHFNGSDPFAAAAAREARFYLWAGCLVIVIIALLAWLVARYVGAQMRLARMKNELVSTVSHELRTPLASMRALVDTLAAKRFRDERQLDEYLQLVAKENQRLSQLIENFLAFSRMERGQHPFHFESVSPQAIVATALDAVRERLTSHGCIIEVQTAAGLPLLHADTDALATVLINLLDNACKYSEPDKRIALRVSLRTDEIWFEVEDHGIGLDPKEAKRIFDRFYQVDQSLTRQRGGCGLGLSIVQSIIRAHGGTVEVDSEPGKGSTFRVRIPIHQAKPLKDANGRLASADVSAH